MNTRKQAIILLTVAVVVFLVQGCGTTPVNIAPMPPDKYEKLGLVSGEACGSLGIMTPLLYFIPMGLNSRVERAYQRAINSAPGATGLINVEMKDDWFWWLIALTRCTTITGEAIKAVSR